MDVFLVCSACRWRMRGGTWARCPVSFSVTLNFNFLRQGFSRKLEFTDWLTCLISGSLEPPSLCTHRDYRLFTWVMWAPKLRKDLRLAQQAVYH